MEVKMRPTDKIKFLMDEIDNLEYDDEELPMMHK